MKTGGAQQAGFWSPAFWSDVWAVIRKEWLEWTSSRGFLVNPLVVIAVFGVAVPLVAGQLWSENLLVQWVWIWLPLSMSTGPTIDLIVGERERGTLEVLLSTRLSERAILVGKVAAVALYGWVLVLVCWLAGWLTVRLVYGQGSLGQALVLLAPLALSLLAALFVALAGALISLRAQTTRQAQALTSVLLLGVFLVVALIALQLARWAAPGAAGLELAWVGLLLAILDIALAGWLLGRSQRSEWLIH